MRYRYTKISMIAFGLAAIGTAAHASKDGALNDAVTAAIPSVTITQAISTAEQHVSGRAVRAEYENSRAGFVYDVEVVNGKKVFDVRIDAAKGTVVSSVEDRVDNDDENDERD